MNEHAENGKEKTHSFAVLVENKFGVLAKVASLFSARGYNIDSLCVGTTQDPSISRITLVTRGDDRILEQIRKQLDKLIDTIKVLDLSEDDSVQREMMLIKVNAAQSKRTDILQLVEIFRARIVDVTMDTFVIEATGDAGKLAAFLDLLRPFGIKEISRSGQVAMSRGPKTLKSSKG